MKTRRILYICSGVFNCVIGGIGCFFGLMVFALSKLIKNAFLEASDLVDSFVKELASISSDYEYLLTASGDEVVALVMKWVYIVGAVMLVLGLVWIAFGVLNCLLSTRHNMFFGKRKTMKILFVLGSWLLLTLNIANITTTIAVFLKDKNADMTQELYTSENNN